MARESRSHEILEVFTRHVSEQGYDGTNFSAVASELGLSKGTVVHYFGTKEHMLALVHESYMDHRLAELRLILDQVSTPGEQLSAVLHAFVLYQVEDRAATVAVHREIVRLADREAMAVGRAMREEYLDMVRQIVAAGVDTGEFRPVAPSLQTLLFFGSAQWLWTWFNPDGQQPAGQVASALVDLVLGSLLHDRNSLGTLMDPKGRAAQLAGSAIEQVKNTYDMSKRIDKKRSQRGA